MTIATLLTELETAPYHNRVKRLVALGQQARTDTAVTALLHSLSTAEDFYERQLALLACYGSTDGAQVVAALGDPSRLLRGLALRLVAHTCTDAQVGTAFAVLPRRAQPKLLRMLRQQRREAVVDALLEGLVAGTDARLAQWLYFGTAALVEKHVGAVMPGWGSMDWERLAKYHPAIAFAQLYDQLRTQTPRMRGCFTT
jgi:hypothetical protein